jgi:protein phosphatase
MYVSAITHKGKVRKNNEDFYFIDTENQNLFIVADGMGGAAAGEVASKTAVDTVVSSLFTTKVTTENVVKKIREAIKKANRIIYEMAQEKEELNGMGTTLTMAYFIDDEIYIAHVGDSRAFIMNEEKIKQITVDHTLVEELVRNGSIKREDISTHPRKNVILRALGTEVDVEIDIFELENNNDKVVLCSDGLSNYVEAGEILDISNSSKNAYYMCKKLVRLANDRGGKDNITVVAIDIKAMSKEVNKRG